MTCRDGVTHVARGPITRQLVGATAPRKLVCYLASASEPRYTISSSSLRVTCQLVGWTLHGTEGDLPALDMRSSARPGARRRPYQSDLADSAPVQVRRVT